MDVLWNTVSPWLSAIGFVISLAIIIITFRFLHDTDKTRRLWRNVILVGSAIGALVSFGQAVSNKQLRQTVAHWVGVSAELQKRVDAGDGALADLKARDAKSLFDLKAGIAFADREHEKETSGIRGNLASANLEIAHAKQQSDAVQRYAQGIAAQSNALNAGTRRTLAAVQRTDAQTRAVANESLAVSREAAEKAGVYRVPDDALNAIAADLARVRGRRSATVTCAANLVATCTQFATAFEKGGWKATPLPGVMPYPIGMLDAVPDPNPTTGLIVFYDPARSALGRAIVADLADCGFTLEARALASGPLGVDIGIAVRFLAR